MALELGSGPQKGNSRFPSALSTYFGSSDPDAGPTWVGSSGQRGHPINRLLDYRTNVPYFPAEGAAPYKRDLTHVETRLLDTGHFALETHGEEIASRIEKFFA